MNTKKIFLYFILAFVGISLWNAWVKEHASTQRSETQQLASNGKGGNGEPVTPEAFRPNSVASSQSVTTDHSTTSPQDTATSVSQDQLVWVKTDLVRAGINPKSGDIALLQLLKYPETMKKEEPVEILSTDISDYQVVQSGLTGIGNGDLQFTTAQKTYELKEGDEGIDVVLTAKSREGLLIKKRYHFTRGQYLVTLNEEVQNLSSKPWSGSFYTQIQTKEQKKTHSGLFGSRAYIGGAISSPDKRYQKVSYNEMSRSNLSETIGNGWIAMQERYFVTALIPPSDQITHYYTRATQQDLYTVGTVAPEINLAPGKSSSFQTKFYAGPKINTLLKAAAPGLDLTINYGWLWIISDLIFWLMQKITLLTGNWGWTIVLITVLIKFIFYPLSAASFRSMARMRQLQPRINALKERFSDDKKGLSQATMELYRREKINPLGGCLPMLIQIPVFIALYYVLIESVQLRQAPFIFWLQDLSSKDPYYILPILMGLSMFWTQKLTPSSPDPSQAKMMMFLPLIFTVLFASFPSGLVLYWLVNNCVQGLQQWYVLRKITHQKRHPNKR